MEDQNDQELVILVTLGGWIRGTQVVSAWIADNYTPESAKLLRQPALRGITCAPNSASASRQKREPATRW